MRDFALPPRAWPQVLAHELPGLPAKWLVSFPHALKRMLLSPSAFTGWLAPLGTLLALQAPASRPLAFVATALAMLPLGLMTATLFDPRYVVPFLPVFALGAACGAARWRTGCRAGRAGRARGSALLCWCCPERRPSCVAGRSEGAPCAPRWRARARRSSPSGSTRSPGGAWPRSSPTGPTSSPGAPAARRCG